MYNERLLAAIRAESEAADRLIRACARQGALVDSSTTENPLLGALRRPFEPATFTPNDMLRLLGDVK